MMHEVVIEKATLSHLPALIALEQACFLADDGKLSMRAMRYHLRHKHNHIYVALMNNEVVGYVLVQVRRHHWRLYSLAVASASRGQGIGKALLRHVIVKGKQHTLRFLSLEVRATNQSAILLYQSIGFRITARLERYYGSELGLRMRFVYAENTGFNET